MKRIFFFIALITTCSLVSQAQTDTTLNGKLVSKDTRVTSINYQWTKVSGPTGGNITSPGSLVTRITGLVVGVYVYELDATDNFGTKAAPSRTTVTVFKPDDLIINAGPDQTIPSK